LGICFSGCGKAPSWTRGLPHPKPGRTGWDTPLQAARLDPVPEMKAPETCIHEPGFPLFQVYDATAAMAASHRPLPLSLPGRTARSARPAYAGTGAPRPNSRPWGINAILARAAGRLGRRIATRTALATGRLSSVGAAGAAYSAVSASTASTACSTAGTAACTAASSTSSTAPALGQRTGTKGECRHK
jgi:hypothetical protein